MHVVILSSFLKGDAMELLGLREIFMDFGVTNFLVNLVSRLVRCAKFSIPNILHFNMKAKINVS